MSLSGPLLNLGFVMGLVQLGNYFKVGEHNDINIWRGAFLASNLAVIAVCLFVKSKVAAKNDQTVFSYKPQPSPTNPSADLVETTVSEYDQEQAYNSAKQTVLTILMVGALHLYLGYTQPLFLQVFLPWKTLYSSPVIQVHLLGRPAVGELARPWTPPNPLGFGNPAPSAEGTVTPANSTAAAAPTAETKKSQ
ncbi:phosphate transporter (Pho88) [Sorochytrium milnesiophthora]